MRDKHYVVLSAMGTITHSTDMQEFLRLSGLSMDEVLEVLKELAEDGFVTKTKHGYAIAEKGRLALTACNELPDDKAFRFYLALGQPLNLSVRSIKEFFNAVNSVDLQTLEFHVERGDFANWIKTSVGDEVLAKELENLWQDGFRGEALRKQVLLILQKRFGEDVLKLVW